MLAQLTGKILAIHNSSVTLEINGIGFDLNVPEPQQFALESTATIFTHMHWNQEQGPSLYGFSSEFEKQIFALILSCSGVGPKLALAALRDIGPSAFLQAISSHDASALNKVSGIGTKKAEQMIIQLKDKAQKLLMSDSGVHAGASKETVNIKEVGDALTSLGYSRPEIIHALQQVHEQASEHNYVFDQMLRKALSILTKK